MEHNPNAIQTPEVGLRTVMSHAHEDLVYSASGVTEGTGGNEG